MVAAEGEIVGSILVKPTYGDTECEYDTRTGVAAVHQFAVGGSRQAIRPARR